MEVFSCARGVVTDVLVGRVDAELLNRLRELRAELVARGLPTEMVDEGSSGDEEGDGV